jgi:hypothetical protein
MTGVSLRRRHHLAHLRRIRVERKGRKRWY